MSNNAALVWNGNNQIAILTEFALARQARIVTWVSSAVYIIFFSVAHLRQ
jgi:hypothetical protein